MAWRIEWEDEAVKELKKLDKQAQKSIVRILSQRIATDDDPRRFGERLRGDLKNPWKYRIGAYRLICSLADDGLVVLIVRVGHRRSVYKI